MPVTPTGARAHTRRRRLTLSHPPTPPPTLPSSVQASESTRSCITNLRVFVCRSASKLAVEKLRLLMPKKKKSVRSNGNLVVQWGRRAARSNLHEAELYACARTVHPFIKKKKKGRKKSQPSLARCTPVMSNLGHLFFSRLQR